MPENQTTETPPPAVKVLVVPRHRGDLPPSVAALKTSGAMPISLLRSNDLDGVHDHMDRTTIDVVLLELPPGVNGVEPVRSLRGRYPSLPLVALSTVYDQDQAIACLHAGAQDYVAKRGLQPNRLMQVIQFAIERERWRNRYQRHGVSDTQLIPFSETGILSSIPGYRVLRLLGTGSMGTVYLVRRRVGDPDRRYALKMPNVHERDPELISRFIREAQVAASIDHPNIVRVHEIGNAPQADIPYMVMEYVDGCTMAACLHQLGELDPVAKARIILQLSEALRAIHARFICHRDIKPQNIMIARDGTAKISDFGTVRIIDSELTLANEVIGTPGYMAPEAFSTPLVDGRADIWALGIVAYRLFVGAIPFRGDTLAALARSIQTERPPDPRRFRADFPSNLRRLLGHMLRKDPDRRIQTAADLSHAWRQFIEVGPSDSWNILDAFSGASDWS